MMRVIQSFRPLPAGDPQGSLPNTINGQIPTITINIILPWPKSKAS